MYTDDKLVCLHCIGDILGHYQVRSARMRRRNAGLAYPRRLRHFAWRLVGVWPPGV